jgi:hypothetical protein
MPRKKSAHRKSHRKVAPKKSAKKKPARRRKTTSVGRPPAALSAQIHQGVKSEFGGGSEAESEIPDDNTEYGGEA